MDNTRRPVYYMCVQAQAQLFVKVDGGAVKKAPLAAVESTDSCPPEVLRVSGVERGGGYITFERKARLTALA